MLAGLTTGVRLLVTDGAGAIVADATASPSAFDKTTKRGWKKLKFRSPSGVVRHVAFGQTKRKPGDVKVTFVAALGQIATPASLLDQHPQDLECFGVQPEGAGGILHALVGGVEADAVKVEHPWPERDCF